MDIPYFRCEDCGHKFPKTEFMPDIEDEDVPECPNCGGLDIQLVDAVGAEDAPGV
jgi:putative FmdB family regulatory protein